MSLHLSILILAGALLLGRATFAAEDGTNAPPQAAAVTVTNLAASTDTGAVTSASTSAVGTGFESFRIIAERNIFNQNRSTRSARRDAPRTRPAAVVQSLSLVGTMTYEKGDFAFFDGSSADYKKPVKPGEKIAGYEVKEIQPSSVKIANEKQEFELKVGQQLRREDQGEWRLASASSAVSTGSVAETRAETATSSPGTPSEEEALKRLMEKRAKELNQ
jgi:hypothetical protein